MVMIMVAYATYISCFFVPCKYLLSISPTVIHSEAGHQIVYNNVESDAIFSCVLRACTTAHPQGCHTLRPYWTRGSLAVAVSVRVLVFSCRKGDSKLKTNKQETGSFFWVCCLTGWNNFHKTKGVWVHTIL